MLKSGPEKTRKIKKKKLKSLQLYKEGHRYGDFIII